MNSLDNKFRFFFLFIIFFTRSKMDLIILKLYAKFKKKNMWKDLLPTNIFMIITLFFFISLNKPFFFYRNYELYMAQTLYIFRQRSSNKKFQG